MSAPRRQGPDIGAVAALLDERIDEVIAYLQLAGRREGREFVALNPTRADRNLGSFRIDLSGHKRGRWKEFSGGEGGDALDLVAYCQGWSKSETLKWALAWLGLDGGDPAALQATRRAQQRAERHARLDDEDAEKRRRLAHALWLGGRPVAQGDPVDLYLRGRGIDLRTLGKAPGALRFHPAVPIARNRGGGAAPGMVAAVQDGGGKFLSAHRTWLRPSADGGWTKKTSTDSGEPLGRNGKQTLGGYAGGFIRLWRGASGKPLRDAADGEVVAVTEGIEDGLTVALACPHLRVIAAVAVGNMINLRLPPSVGGIIVCADNDTRGSEADKMLGRAMARWVDDGRTVSVARAPCDFKDFNEMVQRKVVA